MRARCARCGEGCREAHCASSCKHTGPSTPPISFEPAMKPLCTSELPLGQLSCPQRVYTCWVCSGKRGILRTPRRACLDSG